MMENTLPIACTLSGAELEQRQKTTLHAVVAQAQETRALNDGYAFRFQPGDTILEQIMSLIRKERKCCRFLQFDLRVAPDEGPIWLELTGPQGTGDFLRTTLELSA